MHKKSLFVFEVSQVSHMTIISGFIVDTVTRSSSNFGSTDLALIKRMDGRLGSKGEGFSNGKSVRKNPDSNFSQLFFLCES